MKSMLISRWKTSCSEMKVSVEARPWMCRIPSKIVRMRCSLSTVALHDLRDLLQLLDGLRQELRVAQRDADVGANVEAHHLGVHHKAAAEDHPGLVELADTLVDGSSRDAAFAGDLQERHAGVLDQELEDLAIDRIQGYFRHGWVHVII